MILVPFCLKLHLVLFAFMFLRCIIRFIIGELFLIVFRICLVFLQFFLLRIMTRRYSGEFAHKNYASLFCEVFDSSGSFCALFHYRVYCGKPMLTIDNVSLGAGMLKFEVMNFLSKAVVSCNYPDPAKMTVELTDLPLF